MIDEIESIEMIVGIRMIGGLIVITETTDGQRPEMNGDRQRIEPKKHRQNQKWSRKL